MINQDDGPRRALLLQASLDSAQRARAHREALLVLRSSIETAHIDAYSNAPWPHEVLAFHERALLLGQDAVAQGTRSAKNDPGMGIDIDVRDDAQFEILVNLAPHTIHAEGRRGSRTVFTASDTGSAPWASVTQPQEAELTSRLMAYGIAPTAFGVDPR